MTNYPRSSTIRATRCKEIGDTIMKTVKNIIIGFGKGGKTLAKFLAQKGEEVLVLRSQIRCMVELVLILHVCHLSV